MLVIGRKAGEALRIGPDITITVREVRGKQVKLLISAPPSVAVARTELDRQPESTDAMHEGRGTQE